MDDRLLGHSLGRYRVVRLLGAGGMGNVYEAIHEQLGRRAALKVLHPQHSRREDLVQRLFNEARAVNLIRHPGVVDVHEMGRLPDGSAYLLMEHLAGETLAARLVRMGGRLPGAARICRQIASVLAAAHARGVVHRDIKPENVMLVPDPEVPAGERVKLLDFGIAKLRDRGNAAGATRAGTVLGTPVYMAPEQCRGAVTVDDRADVYSLGVLLFEALAGRPPFVSAAPGVLMAMHLTQPPPELRALCPGLAPALYALVDAMLAKAPAQRPSMHAVAEVLSRVEALPAPAPGDDEATPAPPSLGTPAPVCRTIDRTDVLGRPRVRAALGSFVVTTAALLCLASIEPRPEAAAVEVPAARAAAAAPVAPVIAIPVEVPVAEPPPAGEAAPASSAAGVSGDAASVETPAPHRRPHRRHRDAAPELPALPATF